MGLKAGAGEGAGTVHQQRATATVGSWLREMGTRKGISQEWIPRLRKYGVTVERQEMKGLVQGNRKGDGRLPRQ